jgi:hypothetical protein
MFMGVEAEKRDAVVPVFAARIVRPDGSATARNQTAQARKTLDQRDRLAREQVSVFGWVQTGTRRCRTGTLDTAIVFDKVLQQQDDRVAAGDEVIVGDAQMERCRVGDDEKPEWIEAPRGGKREIELPLDFAVDGRERIGAVRENRDGRRRGTTGPFITQSTRIETEAGKAELLESPPDARFEPRRVQQT